LGAATKAAVVVHWLDGKKDMVTVDANQVVTIKEGKGVVAHTPLKR
jgi:hypothetical protein